MIQGAKATKENWRDNYQTPPEILDRVGLILGPDWFDPCPSSSTFDGLAVKWPEICFINPPFSQYSKWVEHAETQNCWAEIWICHHSHDTEWFKRLIRRAEAICLLSKRVKFIDPRDGKQTRSTAIGKCQSLIFCGPRFKLDDWQPIIAPMGTIVYLKKEVAA